MTQDLNSLALMQAMLGHTNETRWLRYARTHLSERFPYPPQQSGYNKRLRKAAGLIHTLIRYSATDTSVRTDNTWVIDSTPVERARSRETVKRSDLAGWARYGYRASHCRFFWGLRPHLVRTLSALPVAFAFDRRQSRRTHHPDRHARERSWSCRSAPRTGTDRGQEPLRA